MTRKQSLYFHSLISILIPRGSLLKVCWAFEENALSAVAGCIDSVYHIVYSISNTPLTKIFAYTTE